VRGSVQWRCDYTTDLDIQVVFITAVPITKLFAGGGGGGQRKWRTLKKDYPLPLAVIHGLVTISVCVCFISTPGPVQNTLSTEQLQVQDY
jgi:hypothetical protein